METVKYALCSISVYTVLMNKEDQLTFMPSYEF